MTDATPSQAEYDIAVVAVSGRFPGAEGVEQFWDNLVGGVESVTTFSDEQLLSAGVDPSLLGNPRYVKSRPLIRGVDLFDASFFGINPSEARLMDPQQRIFLECAWEAIEAAGYDPSALPGLVGVYGGCGLPMYLWHNLLSLLAKNAVTQDPISGFQIEMGNVPDYLTSRVSYKLNLRGPSIAIQTACSSSLVAVHYACQDLLNHQCDMALAGGVRLAFPTVAGYLYQDGMILSPDGRVRPFDAKAQGTAFGEGIGLVVLKRLADALADGDSVLAVIKGSAVNNDGSGKVSYTAPSAEAQVGLIAAAQAAAGVRPDTIGYIEAHGTGTVLGDPIEVSALKTAFSASACRERSCALGSVKANIGHLDAAAGIAALIKTVLAVKRGVIPPSANFETPNPRLDLDGSPFYIPTSPVPWSSGGLPRRAGVSAFGIGGTNAHVVVEEAPPLRPGSPSRPWQLLLVSAKTQTALKAAGANLAGYLDRERDVELADVAYTLQVGRSGFEHRLFVVSQDREEASQSLNSEIQGGTLSRRDTYGERPVAFMFTGQGAQYVGMAQGLYGVEEAFTEQLDYCCSCLEPLLGVDPRQLMFPSKAEESKARESLSQTRFTQPCLFAVEYALARLWMSWGVRPSAVIGHSVGEYAAACIAGSLSLDDALRLVARRASLIYGLAPGSMVAVLLPLEQVTPLLQDELAIAAVNARNQCVVSGPPQAVDALKERLDRVFGPAASRKLKVSHAFHSSMMEPVVEPFLGEFHHVALRSPEVPFASTVTGSWVDEEITRPEYWIRNLRSTVRWHDALGSLLTQAEQVLLEIGPGTTLCNLAQQHPDRKVGHAVVASIRHPSDGTADCAFLQRSLGQLWQEGVPVDWRGYYGDETRRRVALPTYPFERKRYWIEPNNFEADRAALTAALDRHSDIGRWFYAPSWKRVALPLQDQITMTGDPRSCWLLFVDEFGAGALLAERVRAAGTRAVCVSASGQFERIDEDTYALNPAVRDHYARLFSDLEASETTPDMIVHLWSFFDATEHLSSRDLLEKSETLGFASLLYLGQELSGQGSQKPVEVRVVSSGVHDVTGNEELYPERSTLLGPVKVMPQEVRWVSCQNIDFAAAMRDDRNQKQVLDLLWGELNASIRERIICYRGGHRWVQTFESLAVPPCESSPFRENGVYLIVGGWEGNGYAVARHLAQSFRATLVMVEPVQCSGNDREKRNLLTRALQELGGVVDDLEVGLPQDNNMGDALDGLSAKGGRIDAVIMAGDIPNQETVRFLTEIDRPFFTRQLQHKGYALYALESLADRLRPDRVLIMSSTTSVLGGLGYCAHSAAGAFVDAFVALHNRHSSSPWMVGSWDDWQPEVEGDSPDEHLLARLAPTIEEGVESLSRAVGSRSPQLLISAVPLEARLDRWPRLEGRPQSTLSGPGSKHDISAGPQEQPRNASVQGKIDRKALPEPELKGTDRQPEYVAPRDESEELLAQIWADVLGVSRVSVQDSFFDLGGDSLLAARLFSAIEKATGRTLPLATLFRRPTVEGVAVALRAQEPGDLWSVVVPIRKAGTLPPLFLVHGAEGNVLLYRSLASHLPDGWPVYGLQSEGLDGRKDFRPAIQQMASAYLESLASVQPRGPYYLGGYCMGGTVALEMAQQLRRQGEDVALLAMFETYNEHVLNGLRGRQAVAFINLLENLIFHAFGLLSVRSADSAAFLRGKVETARMRMRVRLEVVGERLSRLVGRQESLSYHHLLVAKANEKAQLNYVPEPYDGKMTLFRPMHTFTGYRDNYYGWAGVAAGGIDVRVLPFYPRAMLSEPFVRILAADLASVASEGGLDVRTAACLAPTGSRSR